MIKEKLQQSKNALIKKATTRDWHHLANWLIFEVAFAAMPIGLTLGRSYINQTSITTEEVLSSVEAFFFSFLVLTTTFNHLIQRDWKRIQKRTIAKFRFSILLLVIIGSAFLVSQAAGHDANRELANLSSSLAISSLLGCLIINLNFDRMRLTRYNGRKKQQGARRQT